MKQTITEVTNMEIISRILICMATITVSLLISPLLNAGTVSTVPAVVSTSSNQFVTGSNTLVQVVVTWKNSSQPTITFDYFSPVTQLDTTVVGKTSTTTFKFPASCLGTSNRLDVVIWHGGAPNGGNCTTDESFTFYGIVPQITSTTVATTPTPTSRTTVGVGEVINCSTKPALPSGYTPNWNVTNAGIISSTGQYTVGDIAETEDVKLTDPSGNLLNDLSFSVLAPSGTPNYSGALTDASENYYWQFNAGFSAQMVINPTTVSFGNVQIEEEQATATGSGVMYGCQGQTHEPNGPVWVKALQIVDTAWFSSVDVTASSPYAGRADISIPMDYLVNGITHSGFVTETQSTTCDSTAKVTTSKDGSQKSHATNIP